MGGRPRVLRVAGLALAAALLLGVAAVGWAYRHLDGNIESVDIDGALGDDRPPRPQGPRPPRRCRRAR